MHGGFRAYALQFGNEMYCDEEIMVEPTAFQCRKWNHMRGETNNRLCAALMSQNFVKEITSTEQSWRTIHNMFRRIMNTKEDFEWIRQADDPHF